MDGNNPAQGFLKSDARGSYMMSWTANKKSGFDKWDIYVDRNSLQPHCGHMKESSDICMKLSVKREIADRCLHLKRL